MPIARSTLVGAVTGIVLLAAIVGFGAVLPKATGHSGDSSASAAETALPTLPDHLGSLTAYTEVTPAQAGAKTKGRAQQVTAATAARLRNEQASEARLRKLYGDAAVRSYIDPKGLDSSMAAVTVIPGQETGLVMPGGPLLSNGYDLTKLNGYECSISLLPSVPGGPPRAGDYAVECRANTDGLTYDVYAIGLQPEDAAGLLTDLLAETGH